jgi:hypothetical protein
VIGFTLGFPLGIVLVQKITATAISKLGVTIGGVVQLAVAFGSVSQGGLHTVQNNLATLLIGASCSLSTYLLIQRKQTPQSHDLFR